MLCILWFPWKVEMFHTTCIWLAMSKAFFWDMMATFVFFGSSVKFKRLLRAPRTPRITRAPRKTKLRGPRIRRMPRMAFGGVSTKEEILFSSRFKIFFTLLLRTYKASSLCYQGSVFLVAIPFSFIVCTMQQLRDDQLSLHSTKQKQPRHSKGSAISIVSCPPAQDKFLKNNWSNI